MTEESSLLKQAFLALQDLQVRLDAAERRNKEPVAVIGIGCRLPGGVVDPDTFWQLLREGREAVSNVPSTRWDSDAYYDPDPAKPGKMVTRRGGFIDQVDRFDARFFEIAPREAVGMDPQQRLALEVAWEALENAGCAPASLRGTKTGIFFGIASRDYSQLGLQLGDPELLDAHYTLGVSHSVASGRISYLLGLEGPSVSIDTACSSSLVAVHLACQSLRTGDSTLALAGGINLMLAPETTALLSRLQMLSPEGRCRAFDADANGFVRGEGCGIVALKLLSQAQADGDRILAVIRGTAVNQDGASSSLTAPNGPSQVNLIRQALANGGVAPGEVSYIEAHGTGTALGDPIELQALGAVYGAGRTADKPLRVGSLKTNIGHLEAAAGISGFIKAVLALGHRQIPAHLHLQTPTPHVRWNELRLTVPTTLTDWDSDGLPRIAAASSFGYSGTNAHVVIAEAPPVDATRTESGWPVQILAVSAKSKSALEHLVALYREHLQNHSETDLRDFCFTANAGRSHFGHRACFVAVDADAMQEKLVQFEAADRAVSIESRRIGFLFTGQGSQYGGMGRELYASSPVFRDAIERCALAWKQETGESLIDVLYPAEGSAGRMDIAKYAQPALFAFEYALAELWRSWGVEPSVLLGHSLGEYVAAVIAEVFSMEDGLRLVCARARLMDTLTAVGAMRAVSAPVERVQAAIAGQEKEVGIGVINGPESVVISGAADAVNRIATQLEADGIRTRALQVTHAFHSPLLEPILDEFERCAVKVKYQAPRIRIISNLTGEAARPEEIATPKYWRNHMRGTVLFHAGLQAALDTGCETFIEIGPQPHLISLAKSAHSDPRLIWLPSARKARNAWLDILSAVQTLYQLGAEIDWRALHGRSGHPIALPTYPFERQRYWFSKRPVHASQPEAARPAEEHPLLGAQLRSPMSEIQYESLIGPGRPAYLGEHVVGGHRIIPAAGYVEMALTAAARASGEAASVKNVVLLRPCVFDEPQILQCVLQGTQPGSPFAIYSRPQASEAKEWVLHATGETDVGADPDFPEESREPGLGSVRKRCREESDVVAFYRIFAENQANFGPTFRPLTRIFLGPGEALVEFELASEIQADVGQYQIHPVALDACFQSVVALLFAESESDDGRRTVYLPAALESLHLTGDPRNLVAAHAQIRQETRRAEGAPLVADVRAYDRTGKVLVYAKGLALRPLPQAAQSIDSSSVERHSVSSSFYEVEWTAVQPDPTRSLNFHGTCLLCGDGEMVSAVSSLFEKRNIVCATMQWDGSGASNVSYQKTIQAVPNRGCPVISDCLYLAPLGNGSSEQGLAACLDIAQGLLRLGLEETPRLWIITRGAQGPNLSDTTQSTLWGFGRSLAAEHPEMRVIRIDLDPSPDCDPEDLLRCMQAMAAEDELALRGREMYAPRLRPVQANDPGTRHATITGKANLHLKLTEPGTLDGIEILPTTCRDPGPGEVEIRVAAAGLNFRDVLNALGMYRGKSGPLGGECAGIVVRVGPGVESLRPGDEVIALGQGCFANFLTTRADMVWPKPANLSFEAAVTIPIAFLTAWYGLKSVAGIQPGERILIHAGAGGVGLAAIQIAQGAGAIVFATAGSPEKRAYLNSIGVNHVMDSRSLDFAREVQEITSGEGVDVVLNSLAGPFIDAGIDILSPGGRFVELGVADIRSAESVAQIRPDISYHAFNLAPALEAGDSSIREMLTAIFEQFRAGNLHPLPKKSFTLENAQDAFRYMAQARHIGRVVLCPAGERSAIIRKNGAYLVTGGLSGIGLEVAAWLAERGAGHVIVMGRSSASVQADAVFRNMRDQGTLVTLCQGDVAIEADVSAAIDKATGLALRGVFHCAGVFDDGALLQQDWERFQRVLAPKVDGATHLDRLTAGLALDHFVMFSSVASVMGSPGQTNYAAANAFLDSMAHSRRSRGLPGLSINWGAWSETGFAARNRTLERGARIGLHGFSTREGLRALESLLTEPRAQVMVASIDWDTHFAANGAGHPNPFLSNLRPSRSAEAPRAARPEKKNCWLPQLEKAAPGTRPDMLMHLLEARVQATLGLSTGQEIDPAQPLQELGLDSLLSIELRNALSTCVDRKLPATLLFNYPTLNALAGFLLRDVLTLVEGGPVMNAPPTLAGPGVESSPGALVDDIEALSDEEVDRLLSARAAGAVG